MGVPECFVGLLTHLVVGCRIHQQHAEEHNVTCYATCLGVVDIEGCLWTKLVLLDIVEVDVVSEYMDRCEYQQRVGHLSVEPLRLVEW